MLNHMWIKFNILFHKKILHKKRDNKMYWFKKEIVWDLVHVGIKGNLLRDNN